MYVDSSEDDETLLHCAVVNEIQEMVQILLENGTNPNITNELGKTPLNYAVGRENRKIVRVLLENGANPNVVDEDGLTPLHYIFKERSVYNEGLMEIFFKINEDQNQKVEVDAQDKLGNTALHLALKCMVLGVKMAVESLLRRGAGPNVANAEGSTPLHLICKKNYNWYYYENDDLAELFFKINEEKHQAVEVDAVDNSGQTPLQLAVANVLPNAVHAVVDHGADLSNFLFTTESIEARKVITVVMKLKVISGVLAIMEHLENGGYEITRSHALKIMNIFHVYGFLKNSTNLEEYWNDKEQMAIETKEIMINSSLSLYDLIQLRPKEAAKLLTYTDCYKFMNTGEISELPEEPRKACVLHLCEKLSRGFFRCWALECFMELTHCRLPLECCELIIDESFTNEQLSNICLATTVQSS